MDKLRTLLPALACGLLTTPVFADLITVGSPGSQGLAQVFDLTLEPSSQAGIWDLASTPLSGGAAGAFDDFQMPALLCAHGCSLAGSLIPIDPQLWGTLEVKFTNGTSFVSAAVSPVFDGEVRMIALNSSGNPIGGCDGFFIGGIPPQIDGTCGFKTSFNPSTSFFGTFQFSAPGISEVLISGAYSCAGCGVPGAASVGGVQFAVPEPGTFALLAAGLFGIGFAQRRRTS